MTRDREFYIDVVVNGYFGSMDSGNIEGTMACFAPDATLTWETADMVLTGHDALRGFFSEYIEGTPHAVARSPQRGGRHGESDLRGGDPLPRRPQGRSPTIDMENCNFFDFGSDGTFTRVHFWSGGSVD